MLPFLQDETCVICNECYQASNHEGHDVYFYHSTVGGCCDCGDCDAWKSTGFCDKHGHVSADPVRLAFCDVLCRFFSIFFHLLMTSGLRNWRLVHDLKFQSYILSSCVLLRTHSYIPRDIVQVSNVVFDEIAEGLYKYANYVSSLYDLEKPRRNRDNDDRLEFCMFIFFNSIHFMLCNSRRHSMKDSIKSFLFCHPHFTLVCSCVHLFFFTLLIFLPLLARWCCCLMNITQEMSLLCC